MSGLHRRVGFPSHLYPESPGVTQPTVGRLVALSHAVVRATVAVVAAAVAMVAVGCILRLQVGHRASSGSVLPAPPHRSPCKSAPSVPVQQQQPSRGDSWTGGAKSYNVSTPLLPIPAGVPGAKAFFSPRTSLSPSLSHKRWHRACAEMCVCGGGECVYICVCTHAHPQQREQENKQQ